MLDILLPSVHTAFPGLNSPRRVFSSFCLWRLWCTVLLVLLSTPQYLEVACLLGEELLGRPDEASGAPLLDLVLRDQACLLGLDDLVAGLDALRTTRPKDCQYFCCGLFVSGGRIGNVRFGRDLLLGLGLLELCLRHFRLIDSPLF